MTLQDTTLRHAPATSLDDRVGLRISCVRHGTVGLRVALAACAAFALLWCIGWVRQEGELDQKTWAGLGTGVAIAALTSTMLLWCTIGRTDFVLGADSLTVERRLLGWRRSRAFRKDSIRGIRAVREGGRDGVGNDDSFPSWSLVLEGTRHVAILRRVERRRANWLGLALAEWAGVPFHPPVDVEPL